MTPLIMTPLIQLEITHDGLRVNPPDLIRPLLIETSIQIWIQNSRISKLLAGLAQYSCMSAVTRCKALLQNGMGPRPGPDSGFGTAYQRCVDVSQPTGGHAF